MPIKSRVRKTKFIALWSSKTKAKDDCNLIELTTRQHQPKSKASQTILYLPFKHSETASYWKGVFTFRSRWIFVLLRQLPANRALELQVCCPPGKEKTQRENEPLRIKARRFLVCGLEQCEHKREKSIFRNNADAEGEFVKWKEKAKGQHVDDRSQQS